MGKVIAGFLIFLGLSSIGSGLHEVADSIMRVNGFEHRQTGFLQTAWVKSAQRTNK
jgi:hypothetical protein